MHVQTPVTKVGTRQQILNLLKHEGAMDSAQLAKLLKVSAMAVRQHLYELQEQGLVTYFEEAKTVGRPAKQWQLTPSASIFFPTGYVDLTVNLLRAMREAFGQEGLDKLLAIRMREQVDSYQAQINPEHSLRQKLDSLAQLRANEGYMAAVLADEKGELLLIENHCPICDAAKTCISLCERELETFQKVLGEGAKVERVEHILGGARRCAYRIVERMPDP